MPGKLAEDRLGLIRTPPPAKKSKKYFEWILHLFYFPNLISVSNIYDF